MPTFNIEKTEFKTTCGIKEEDIRNIIEDSFPVADTISFQKVANNIRIKLENLGYDFNVYVIDHFSHLCHLYCGLSYVCGNNLIEYHVKYNGQATDSFRSTTGHKFLVMIWN